MPVRVPYYSFPSFSKQVEGILARDFQEYEARPAFYQAIRPTSYTFTTNTTVILETTATVPPGAGCLVSISAHVRSAAGGQALLALETVFPDGTTELQPSALILDTSTSFDFIEKSLKWNFFPTDRSGRHVFRVYAQKGSAVGSASIPGTSRVTLSVWTL